MAPTSPACVSGCAVAFGRACCNNRLLTVCHRIFSDAAPNYTHMYQIEFANMLVAVSACHILHPHVAGRVVAGMGRLLVRVHRTLLYLLELIDDEVSSYFFCAFLHLI
jgi:hypothetical protein